jgi:hypothetical protein
MQQAPAPACYQTKRKADVLLVKTTFAKGFAFTGGSPAPLAYGAIDDAAEDVGLRVIFKVLQLLRTSRRAADW